MRPSSAVVRRPAQSSPERHSLAGRGSTIRPRCASMAVSQKLMALTAIWPARQASSIRRRAAGPAPGRRDPSRAGRGWRERSRQSLPPGPGERFDNVSADFQFAVQAEWRRRTPTTVWMQLGDRAAVPGHDPDVARAGDIVDQGKAPGLEFRNLNCRHSDLHQIDHIADHSPANGHRQCGKSKMWKSKDRAIKQHLQANRSQAGKLRPP